MISLRTTWRLKTYFLCLIIFLVSMSAFAGVEHVKNGHLKWTRDAVFKPFYRAFTAPDMKKYKEFCENPRHKRIEYLDEKRSLANQNDIKSAYQYGAIAVYAPCSQINKMVGKTYLTKAADAGSVDAIYLLGLATQSKNNNMMQQAANIGHPEAAYNIAISQEGAKDIHTLDKYFLYAIEGNVDRAKHDYALFLLKHMRYFKEAKLHYAHNLLKEVMLGNQATPLAGHAAYNIFLLQQRYPQIIYQKKDADMLYNLARKYGLVPLIQHKKATIKEQKSQKIVSLKKTNTLDVNEKFIMWENQEAIYFGNKLY